MRIFPIANYNYRTNQSKLPKANVAENICVPQFRSTIPDDLCFSAKMYTIKNVLGAKVTDGYKISDREARAITDAIPIMAKTQFSKKDYEKLSIMEKTILREIVRKDMYAAQSINEDMQDILDVSEKLKKHLDKKYPEGYKLVGIGRSPEPITDAMRALGADAISIPFSRATLYSDYPHDIQKKALTKADWQNYFKYHGLDVNEVNNGNKKIIFTDYVSSGKSICLFNSILSGTGFLSKNVKLENIQQLMNKADYPYTELVCNKLGECEWKKYCKSDTVQQLYHLNYILYPGKFSKLPQSMTSKLFEFALYDNLETHRMTFL